ncbi:MAG: substrate-binding domain-containing protein [Cellulomonadaceae bacterium]|nr:substrate-binding domain-containing protein [Cellulomonadaceae bacterium]
MSTVVGLRPAVPRGSTPSCVLVLGSPADTEASRGRCLPEDASVTGFDDQPVAAMWNPALTTVRQDFVDLGRRVLGLLSTSARPQLVIRESTSRRSPTGRESSGAPQEPDGHPSLHGDEHAERGPRAAGAMGLSHLGRPDRRWMETIAPLAARGSATAC